MHELIKKSIDFSKSPDFNTDNLAVEVKKASIDRETLVLKLELELNFIVSAISAENIRTNIKRAMPDIRDVELNIIYKDVKGSEVPAPEKKAKKSNGNGTNGGTNGGAGGGGTWNGGNGGWNGAGGKGKRKGRGYRPVKGNIIMGSPVTIDCMPLDQIDSESGTVAFEGELFKKDSRTISEDRKLASLYVTNKKTSICVKAFVHNKKWEDFEEHLPDGTPVKIEGKAQWDRYDNAVTVIADSIEKTERKERRDEAPEKRVELHCHTKMSAMDGLIVAKEMVKRVEGWGHKAVAITDHGVVQSFPEAAGAAKNIKIIYGCEGYLLDDEGLIREDGSIDYKSRKTNHIIILVKDLVGLKNLYKLVSKSHIDYFYYRPRIPRSVLEAHREGLILGSACEAGELYSAIRAGEPDEKVEKIASFYDYLEIQPLINNRFMITNGIVESEEDLKDLNRRIVALGEKLGKLVVATCDAHYFDEEEALYRRIIMAGQDFKDAESGEGLYFRTTEEMLEEFAYLGEEKAYEVVVTNTNKVADMIESIKPVPDGKFPPHIDGAEEYLREACETRAAAMYGNPLPDVIRERLDKELNSIIDNGYAVMYRSAEMLVNKSMEAGYLVGSRGSVGSSFAATMSGITEVNPLAAHYLCPKCKNIEWDETGEYDCGVDMPDKVCPVCGTPYTKQGFTIPFETFLGFDANKEPDIDLNFANEYQTTAQKYVEEIFGAENVYKAGTISTVKANKAFGYVAKYFEQLGQQVSKAELDRLTQCCEGVKATTGQHPGGVVVVPKDHEIFEFCPVQRPANNTKSEVVTTHYDYHSIDQNLLKLDILGHDIPSMCKQLKDLTGVDPLDVPLKDDKVMSIFIGTEGLDIKDPDYKFTHGSYAIHEFGTSFVRQMLDDIHPTTVEELVRISGLSHGTDVWLGNAQDLVVNGVTTMREAIATRDDIMNYLRKKGVDNSNAFTIMEKVRKGKGVTEEQEQLMIEHDVPDWYIDSCRKIKYMFPRAHAVAYVMMSLREAYYKVYHPLEFYAVYFTTKVASFDEKVILKGQKAVEERMEEIERMGKDASKKDENDFTVLEVAYEMYARGFEFAPARLGISDATKFRVHDGKVILPFVAIAGMGEGAATAFAEGYADRPYETVEDVIDRGRVNKTVVEQLREHGVLEGLPETAQISFF